MKISKKSWLFIAIGFFLIALVGLWMVYSQQAEVKEQLKKEHTSALARLNSLQIEQLADRQKDLEKQLTETVSRSKAAREILSKPISSITISEALFNIAEANSVNITEMISSEMTGEDLEGVPCLALRLTAKIQGELTHLIDFITQLNNDLATGVVNSVDIAVPDGVGRQNSLAEIKVVVYTHRGS